MGDTESGYVYSVSPKKKSRKSAFPYFEFKLQTTEEQSKRVVCYDESKRDQIRSFHDTKEPVKLRNITRKQSIYDANSIDIFINKRSKIEKANNSSVTFEFDKKLEHDVMPINIDQLPKLSTEELVTVQGRLTFEGEPTVKTSHEGATLTMLERCVITDDTSTVKFTLWNDLINEVTNDTCYIFTNVRIKDYNSKKYLTATPNTQIKKTQDTFPSPETFQELFDFHIVTASRVELLDHYKKFYACKSCKKFLTDILTDDVIKCQCGAIQEVSTCPLQTSVRIQLKKENGELIWLTAFQPVFEPLFEDSPVTLDSDEDAIYKFLFKKLKNFTVKHQGQIVKDIKLA